MRSQTTSTDSICFSKVEAIRLFKDLKKLDVFDSIISNQSLQIYNFKEIVINDKQQILLHTNMIARKQKELNVTNLKLKISRKLSVIGIPVSVGLGLVVGILISK